MSRHSLDHAQSPQTGTCPSSRAQMSISQLLIWGGMPLPTALILPRALFFLQKKPTRLPWTGATQPPPTAGDAQLRGQDSGESWCGQDRGYQIRFMRSREKGSQADSVVLHWYLVSFPITYSIEDTGLAGMTRNYGQPMRLRKGSWSPGSIH